MNRRDRPVLRSRHRNRNVLPARAVRLRQNVRRKETGRPRNAAEFRCLVFSFRQNGSAEPSLCVLAGKLEEMPIQQSIIGPQLKALVVRLGLDPFYLAAQLESVA